MIKPYFKIAWRSLMKSKVFSFINVSGLTIGITICMMIFLYVLNEFSFDNFHQQGDHIYRVMRGFEKEDTPYLSAPYATALKNEYPDLLKNVVRLMPTNALITFKEHSFNEKNIIAVDTDFFQLFSFPLIKGDPATALRNPNNVVLTETTAKKFFGEENPIGKVIEMDKETQLTVTGIARDCPSNSHLSFDLVLPLSLYSHTEWFSNWMSNNLFIYVLTDGKKEFLEKKLPAFTDKYLGKVLASFGTKWALSFQPLKDLYFGQGGSFGHVVKHGDKRIVYIFLSVAVLVLLIACINFMNLSTVRAVERAKEVGIRKVVGARKNSLIVQFIGESLLLTLISACLATALLYILMPVYNQVLDHTLSISWIGWKFYAFLVVIILLTGLLAGSYPAFFLSAFSPVQVLKGKLRLGKNGNLFRQGLVVLQFAISAFLIIGTLVMVKQMSYIKNKNLGYDQEQTIVLNIDNQDFYDHRFTFKNELLADPHIQSVSLMSGEPGGFFDTYNFKAEGKGDVIWHLRTEFSDFDIIHTLGLKLIAGRAFSNAFPTDSTEAVIINRAAADKLGYTPQTALGQWLENRIREEGHRRTIVGVVENFDFLSAKENMDGLVISPYEDHRVMLVKLKAGDLPHTLTLVKNTYNRLAPGYPFEYRFLDQNFDQLYKTDLRQQTLLSIFSGLAIFIACLGLFGLASYTATQRTKEIGVRKVLGSSRKALVMLLSKELIKPIGIAMLIASPLAYYVMNNWLQHFAYRITVNAWIFISAAVITMCIALVTIGLKTWGAASANPIHSLRDE